MPQLTIQQALDQAIQYQMAGRLREAEQIYRQILAQQPQNADALHLLGMIAYQTGQHDAALGLMQQAIALKPDYPEAHYNLGAVLKDKGLLDEAIAAYRRAVTLRPDYPEGHNNLGNVLVYRGLLDEAIAAYRQAITIKPGYAEAYHNLGSALQNKGQLDEAFDAYQQAITLKPDYPDAYCNLGNAFKDAGQLDEAIASYRKAMTLRPTDPHAHSNLIYALHYHPGYDAQAIRQELNRWNQQHAEPLKKLIQPHLNDRNPDRRLRIGYVSADFWAHVSAHFLVPLLEHHDPRQVEVFCYAEVARPDEITARMRRCVAGWRSTVGLSDEQVARQIREDRIDILVDLKLHSAHNRLLVFARKPAPVQVTWLGYPGSTGLSTIDYRLSDPYLDPPGMDESVYSEKTIRLLETFWCYDPLDGRDIPVNDLPALKNGYITFGCLNNFCKINEGVLTLWAQVLRQVEGSRLLLLAKQGSHRQRTVEFLRRQGVEPGRVEFLDFRPRRQYLELYHRIDVALDTFPCNGHTTSLDSFWMGVPVVTLMGQTAVGRAGWSQLSNLGLGELAGQSPEQFVRTATVLASDMRRLKKLRSMLRQRMQQSPLMDTPRFIQKAAATLRGIWPES